MPKLAKLRAPLALAVISGTAVGLTMNTRLASAGSTTATGRSGGGKRDVADPDGAGGAERRAVRGSAADDVPSNESAELREIRRFEEQAFPRDTGYLRGLPGNGDGALPPPTLPGNWGGTGDVPPELRSPAPVRAEAAPPPPNAEWLHGLKLPDLPIRWDAQVLRYLDYFKTDPKGRAVMSSWLRRGGRYREMFERALAREGLPKDLFYVAMVESGFENTARSRAGAGGIWQFMPGAARAYGLEVSYWIDNRRDPERAASAAARYLKDLYVRFGSWYLVFAAYNAGYGAVLRSITSYNTNDYWELIRHESGLPWESCLYVPKILAAAVVGNNLAAFGYGDLVPDPPFAYEEVEVPSGTALATVARAAGTRTDALEALNPQLVRGRTPPDRPTVRVRLPPGSAAVYAASFEKVRATDKLETVVLRFGETLDDLARARGTTARELRRINGVKDSGELRAGTAVLAPKRPAKAEFASDENGAAEATDKPAGREPDDTIIVAVPDRSFNYDGRERVFYRARDGDTLDEIADAFGVRDDDLCEWNNLDPSAKLHPRMVLQIFVRKDFDPSGVMLLDATKVRVVTLGSEEFLELETARRGKKRLYYTVRAGDTLPKVGRRYGLTVGDLARINRFSYNTELHQGDRIVVYSPTGEAPREVAQGLTPNKKRPSPRELASAERAAAPASKHSAGPSTATGSRGAAAPGARSDRKVAIKANAHGGNSGLAAHKPAAASASSGGNKSAAKKK